MAAQEEVNVMASSRDLLGKALEFLNIVCEETNRNRRASDFRIDYSVPRKRSCGAEEVKCDMFKGDEYTLFDQGKESVLYRTDLNSFRTLKSQIRRSVLQMSLDELCRDIGLLVFQWSVVGLVRRHSDAKQRVSKALHSSQILSMR